MRLPRTYKAHRRQTQRNPTMKQTSLCDVVIIYNYTHCAGTIHFTVDRRLPLSVYAPLTLKAVTLFLLVTLLNFLVWLPATSEERGYTGCCTPQASLSGTFKDVVNRCLEFVAVAVNRAVSEIDYAYMRTLRWQWSLSNRTKVIVASASDKWECK